MTHVILKHWYLVHFDSHMCFSPQRAFFRHRNRKKCSEPHVFCTFSLTNALLGTVARNFWFLLSPHDSAPAACLLFDSPDTQIIEKTKPFATSLTFRADESFFFWLSRYCIFFLLTLLRFICFSNLHIVGSLLFKLPSTIFLTKVLICKRVPTRNHWTSQTQTLHTHLTSMAATPETKTARPDTECQARRFRFFSVGTERTKHAQSKTYATNGSKVTARKRGNSRCVVYFSICSYFLLGFPMFFSLLALIWWREVWELPLIIWTDVLNSMRPSDEAACQSRLLGIALYRVTDMTRPGPGSWSHQIIQWLSLTKSRVMRAKNINPKSKSGPRVQPAWQDCHDLGTNGREGIACGRALHGNIMSNIWSKP